MELSLVARFVPLLMASVILPVAGCDSSAERIGAAHLDSLTGDSTGGHANPITPMSDDELRNEVDDVLEFTLRERLLNTSQHHAWQILHGVLAYQRQFPVRIGLDGPIESTVAYMQRGGRIEGWEVEPGDLLDAATGRRGLRAKMDPGTKSGQGHHDQWLAILAQCGIQPNENFHLASGQFTMADFVQQVQRDVWRNSEAEWSWTLIGLTAYLPTSASWQAGDGETWSIEKLVEAEALQDIDNSSCGGTHRLIGLATALNHHLSQGGELKGPWESADRLIQNAVQIAQETQNADGGFSTNYFARGGVSPDLADVIRTTGHTLEFLSIGMDSRRLREPWVRQAALRLCDAFNKTRGLPLECGALYHAAHGLALYRHRVLGPRPNPAAEIPGS
jgi:hypothetical protein